MQMKWRWGHRQCATQKREQRNLWRGFSSRIIFCLIVTFSNVNIQSESEAHAARCCSCTEQP